MKNKRFKIFEAKYNGKIFRIEEDLPGVGAYLLILENGKIKADYLQDSIEICKRHAAESFNVPIKSWVFIGFSD